MADESRATKTSLLVLGDQNETARVTKASLLVLSGLEILSTPASATKAALLVLGRAAPKISNAIITAAVPN